MTTRGVSAPPSAPTSAPTSAPPSAPRPAVAHIAPALALATAAAGLAYTIAFVILRDPLLASGSLMLGGLLAIPVILALGQRLAPAGSLTGRSAIMLALIGAVGSTVHGAYDLANALHPPTMLAADLPNPVDPRGVLTFGVAGLALVALGLASQRAGGLPAWLSLIAVANGSLLIALYLARLVVLEPASPFVLGPALLTGFVLGPAWYVGVGVWFLGADRPRARRSLGRAWTRSAWTRSAWTRPAWQSTGGHDRTQ